MSSPEYKRAYYRDYVQPRPPKPGGQELALARRDPQYEKNHHIQSYVLCRLCGLGLQIVSYSHLARHGTTIDAYLVKFPGAQIVSGKFRQQHIRDGKRVKAAERHRTRTMASVHGHPGEPSKRLWDYVDLYSRGWSTKEISAAFSRGEAVTKKAAWSVGMRTAPCLYDLGIPVTRGYIQSLRLATGLEIKTFAKVFGITHRMASGISCNSMANMILNVTAARSIIAVRNAFIRELSIQGRNWQYGKHNLSGVLVSFFPNLKEIYRLVRKVFEETSCFFETQNSNSIASWQDWVCDQARRETHGALPGNLFRRFMPLASEISPFVQARLGSFRGERRISKLAAQALALRLGVSYVAIQRCVRTGSQAARPASPQFTLQIISGWQSERNRVSAKRDGPGPPPDYSTEVLQLADSIEERTGKSWTKIGKMESVYELLPERAQRMTPYERGAALRKRVAEYRKDNSAGSEVIPPRDLETINEPSQEHGR